MRVKKRFLVYHILWTIDSKILITFWKPIRDIAKKSYKLCNKLLDFSVLLLLLLLLFLAKQHCWKHQKCWLRWEKSWVAKKEKSSVRIEEDLFNCLSLTSHIKLFFFLFKTCIGSLSFISTVRFTIQNLKNCTKRQLYKISCEMTRFEPLSWCTRLWKTWRRTINFQYCITV